MANQELLKPEALLKLPAFQWKRLGADFLLTNEWGFYEFLSKKEFSSFLNGKIAVDSPLWQRLQPKGFLRDHLDFEGLARKWKEKNSFLWTAASLHILVLTLRCNHSCSYCQSAAVKTDPRRYDMDWRTAKASIDMAFSSPSKNLSLEFQGGEPLLNWPVLKRAVDYALAKNRAAGKTLKFALVSNFSLLDKEKADFLISRNVSLCTSLDGPEAIHNKNRTYLDGNSYGLTVRWLKELMRRYKKCQKADSPVFKPSALTTVTALALPHAKEVVDEYVRLNLGAIFLRPLSPLGHARRAWRKIGYSPKQFLEFYSQALDRILEHNRRGRRISEKTAEIMLSKIFGQDNGGYMDMRSPCGAAIGQMAYNFDGDVYACDEGRMLACAGDKLFRIGNVFSDSYKHLVSGPVSKACAWSSNLECHPLCFRCVYRPYCGTCPVYNYQSQGSIWGVMPANERHAIYEGLFDILFGHIRKPADLKIFRSWLDDKR